MGEGPDRVGEGRGTGSTEAVSVGLAVGDADEVGVGDAEADGGGGTSDGEGDVDGLVEGTMKQQRLLAVAPRDVTADDVARIFTGSLELW